MPIRFMIYAILAVAFMGMRRLYFVEETKLPLKIKVN